MRECCGQGSKLSGADIALIGNPNVGKSVLINHLTGVGAVVSNYPGTTVEILEGESIFAGKRLRFADLPGIYSLSGISEDERVALDYLKSSKPMVVLNVIDATKLERNLFLTLQLLRARVPVVVALNFHEEAEDVGIAINAPKLSSLLGVPVIPVDALRGAGIDVLVEQCIKILESKRQKSPSFKKPEIEEKTHARASAISSKATKNVGSVKASRYIWLDRVTTEPLSGAIIMLAVMAALFMSLFIVGGGLSGIIGNIFESYAAPSLSAAIGLVPNLVVQEILRYMVIDGVNAGLQIEIPYVFVFYMIIAILEDTGYMPRMAFLMDKVMHKFGLHGKAVIPMMLGFGCSVPAIMSTRVLSSPRERLLTAILITLIPCSAKTAVILGAVGVFIGWQYALLIYGFILALILLTGVVLGKALPGERVGLIMELPPYRIPVPGNILSKTWTRVSDFVFAAFPLILIGSGILGGLKALGLLFVLLGPAEPLVSGWLMLPAIAGITLVFGVLRKELALEMLIVLGGSANLLSFMTPLQIFTFALVLSLYVPCIATIGVIKREFGWKKCAVVSVSTVVLAVAAGGIVARVMPIFGLLS
ncbi:MAG: ferrous iron transporter B [Candidatus Micrarchaeota archaeon]